MRHFGILTLTLIVICGLYITPARADEQADFNTLLEQVQSDASNMPEQDIVKMLQLSRKLGKSFSATLAIKSYLQRQAPPTVILEAARTTAQSGDLTLAIARYKRYFSQVKPSIESSKAIAEMYQILIEQLNAKEDAYLFMSTEGLEHRQSIEARRFDDWLIRESIRKQDYDVAARLLADELSAKRELQQEKTFYWPAIETLMSYVPEMKASNASTLPHLRRLINHFRDNQDRKALYQLYIEQFEFNLKAETMDDRAKSRAFKVVLDAAQDYLKKDSDPRAIRFVIRAFAGGNLDSKGFAHERVNKARVLIEAFNKLSPDQKDELLEWRHNNRSVFLGLVDADIWATAGAKDPRFYVSGYGSRPPYYIEDQNSLKTAKDHAKLLKDVPGRYPAVVRSIAAANGKDFQKAAEQVWKHESYEMRSREAWDLLDKAIFQSIAIMRGSKDKQDHNGKAEATLWYGQQLAKTASAIHEDPMLGAYLRALRYIDLAKVADGIKPIQWIPNVDRNSRRSMHDAQNEIRRWLKGQRKREGAGKHIAAITEALDAMSDGNKAPNAETKLAVQLNSASRGKKKDDYVTAATKLHDIYKDYAQKRQPYGHALVTQLLGNTRFDISEFESGIIKTQLTSYNDQNKYLKVEVIDAAASNVRGREYFGSRRDQQLRMTRYHRGMTDFIKKQAAEGKIDRHIFWRWRGTRAGRDWRADSMGTDVIESMIQNRLFEKTGYRTGGARFASTSYQLLIDREFQKLREKFPPESAFDDRFVEEAKKTNYLDSTYWQEGKDPDKKVRSTAAQMLGTQEMIPLKSMGQGIFSTKGYFDWVNVAQGAGGQAYIGMLDQIESRFGKTRYDLAATGGYYRFYREEDLRDGAKRQAWFTALKKYNDRVATLPIRFRAPRMESLERVSEFTRAEADIVAVTLKLSSSSWSLGGEHDRAAVRVFQRYVKDQDWNALGAMMPVIWDIAGQTRGGDWMEEYLASEAQRLLNEDQADIAVMIADMGLNMLKGKLSASASSTLSSARGKAMSGIDGVIPVPKGDPRYPIYVSQNAYLTNKEESAWRNYYPHRETILSVYQEMAPTFIIWIIEQHLNVQETEFAEELAASMVIYADDNAAAMDPDTRARVYMSQASVAMRSNNTTRARAIYQRVTQNNDFDGTEAQIDALLSIVDIDRINKNYENAESILEDLSKRADRRTRALVMFHQAKIVFDQEDFDQAKEILELALALNPTNKQSRLLLREVMLELRNPDQVIESTGLGPTREQEVIIPGAPLIIRLTDKNLTVIGNSSSIEIKAWTDSGDEETFVLLPLGDRRDIFKGEVPTELAPVSKNNGKIQLLGGDKLHFGYSDAFIKANNIAEKHVSTLEVKTDSELYASSGEILTAEERNERRERERIARELQISTNDGNRERVALSTVRPPNQIKPGNPIHIRVVDPDRSTTNQPDKLYVTARVPSGDVIERFELVETDTHSGVFQGTIQTSSGQPKAYASDSQDGSEPNDAISPGDTQPWVALPNSVKPKTFTVDLNDNIELGNLNIKANVDGRRIKDFILMSSLNGQQYTTLARWPKPYKPWNGQMVMEAVLAKNLNMRTDDAVLRHMETGYLSESAERYRMDITNDKISMNVRDHAYKAERAMKFGNDSKILMRYRFAFYQELPATRVFQLKGAFKEKRYRDAPQFRLFLNNRPADRRSGNPNRIERRLEQGVHIVDVYVYGSARHLGDTETRFDLLVDTDVEPFQEIAKAGMFGGDQVRQQLAQPEVSIKNAAAGSFEVAFPAEVNARMLRLVIVDYESDAPAINKVTLRSRQGSQILPTKESYQQLRQNNVLEIVPNDRVSITYTDPKYITPSKDLLEAFLTATFNNATISAAFEEFTEVRDVMVPSYVAMRRFKVGDDISVFIRDPDMDVSPREDAVKFTASTNTGQKLELVAIETAPHSGIFTGKITTVEGQPGDTDELQIRPGNRVLLSYKDNENLDPGVPWERVAEVDQVDWSMPQVYVYNVTSADLVRTVSDEEDNQQLGKFEELYPNYKNLVATRPDTSEQAPGVVTLGGPLMVEVLNPAIAKSQKSTQKIYVQTSSGLEISGKEFKHNEFDTQVAGTIELSSTPRTIGSGLPWLKGYESVITRATTKWSGDALDAGVFAFNIPYEMGAIEENSGNFDEEVDLMLEDENLKLRVKAGDTIYIGIPYVLEKDPEGEVKWITREFTFRGDTFMEVMDRRFQEIIHGRYVGETAYFRIIDPMRNTTDEKDRVLMTVKSSNGTEHEVDMVETFSHSGIYKGLVRFYRLDERPESEADRDPNGMYVNYGDKITASYVIDGETHTRELEIYKGFDGELLAFTKRFNDEDIAVLTQFAIVESYFELAKKHRQLAKAAEAKGDKVGNTQLRELSRREIALGEKLLEEVLRDYPDTDFMAEAQLLRGNLAMELADDIEDDNPRAKMAGFLKAVDLFTSVVANYPNHDTADSAQYKKALALEKMAAIDESFYNKALEEFVKLSYRYPESEYIADTIVRLGNYFRIRGEKLTKEADELEDNNQQIEAAQKRTDAKRTYQTAAEVYSRLHAQFPEHELASRTMVLAGFYFKEAKRFDQAIKALSSVANSDTADHEIKAEALFWMGESYEEMAANGFSGVYRSPTGQNYKPNVHAYLTFNKVRWDYPDSKWARKVRSILETPAYLKVKDEIGK